jgi:uncharacterized protein
MKKNKRIAFANVKGDQKRVVFTADAKLSLLKFAKGTATEGPSKIATLSGYAILWNVLSSDRGGYKVRLLPGSAAFAVPTLALFHHDFGKVIGNTANGTLRITSDATGVKVEIDIPDTATGNEVVTLVDRRDVTGFSFSMVNTPVSDVTREDGQAVVNCSSYLVDEITVTAIPAFVQTDCTAEFEDDEDDDEEEFEDESDYAKVRTEQSTKLSMLELSMLTL